MRSIASQKKKKTLMLPPLRAKTTDQAIECANEDDPITLEEIEPEYRFKIPPHCFDIRTLFHWVFIQKNATHPLTRELISQEILRNMLNHYIKVQYNAQIEDIIGYRTYLNKEVVAIYHRQIPYHWIILDVHPLGNWTTTDSIEFTKITLFRPILVHDNMKVFKDMINPDKHLDPFEWYYLYEKLRDLFETRKNNNDMVVECDDRLYHSILGLDPLPSKRQTSLTGGGKGKRSTLPKPLIRPTTNELKAVCFKYQIPIQGLTQKEWVEKLHTYTYTRRRSTPTTI